MLSVNKKEGNVRMWLMFGAQRRSTLKSDRAESACIRQWHTQELWFSFPYSLIEFVKKGADDEVGGLAECVARPNQQSSVVIVNNYAFNWWRWARDCEIPRPEPINKLVGVAATLNVPPPPPPPTSTNYKCVNQHIQYSSNIEINLKRL